MKNEERLFPIIEKFYNKIKKEDFVIDKSGVNCAELICENIYLNPMQDELNFYNIRKTPKKYVDDELKWYLSQSLSIIGYVDHIRIWNEICTKDDKKEVNSNYGWCVFNENNYNQYKNCLNELKLNKESRRATMIYNRPAIWEEYKRIGMSDYICTFATQQFIRDNKLIYVVNMRSNDFIKGFFSDFSWHCYVYNKLFKDLKEIYNYLEVGCIIWIANSLHLYQGDFEKIVKIYEEGIKHENKCLSCINGAIVVGERNSVYILKEAINKEKHISYKNNESGCRRLNDIIKSDDCIKNNFKHHEEF